MKVIVQKIDLDTALTAYVLGVSRRDDIVVVRDKANEADLRDPDVLCIECGGSGGVDRLNFDHHDTDQELPAACVQAYRARVAAVASANHQREIETGLSTRSGDGPRRAWGGAPAAAPPADTPTRDEPLLERLVHYVSLLDTQGPDAVRRASGLPEGAFPTFSAIFSGMILVTRDPKEQLFHGMGLCAAVLERQLDPFGLMPAEDEWAAYAEAKRKSHERLERAMAGVQRFTTASGHAAGYVEADVGGVLGAICTLGCQVAVARSPGVPAPPLAKYTIAGNGLRVDSLLPVLNSREAGWGGPAHGTIVGSPRSGSRLCPDEIISIVRDSL